MDSHIKSILKSIIWRIVGVFWLAMITWLVTRSLIKMTLVTFIHHGIFLIVFYLHERIWVFSKIRPKVKCAIKAITYEILLGNIILGLITYFVTDSVKEMSIVTLTYIQSKLILYYFYDIYWEKLK